MDCNIFNCHICSIEKFMRHFTKTLATALVDYNCGICRTLSVGSDSCCNVTCENNPANYPQIMANGVPLSCVCGICTECLDRLNKEIEGATWQETKCECGAEKVDAQAVGHSQWCPKFQEME